MICHNPGNMCVVVLADAGKAGGRFSNNHSQEKSEQMNDSGRRLSQAPRYEGKAAGKQSAWTL
ncbi:hypothetical protein [Hymenobacter qilianensis]|nr:hypothetical protein [Hymenobacter qilianensis]